MSVTSSGTETQLNPEEIGQEYLQWKEKQRLHKNIPGFSMSVGTLVHEGDIDSHGHRSTFEWKGQLKRANKTDNLLAEIVAKIHK